MARFHNLHVYDLARSILRDCATITDGMQGFGDLSNQMRRAAISAVSNIAEGACSRHDKQFIRFLDLARGSANELQAQLGIASDLGLVDPDHAVHDRCDHLGRSLTKLIRSLSG